MKFLEEKVTYDEARELTHLYKIMNKSLADNTIIYYIKEYEVKRSFDTYIDKTSNNPLIIQLLENLGHRKVESTFTYNGKNLNNKKYFTSKDFALQFMYENYFEDKYDWYMRYENPYEMDDMIRRNPHVAL